MATVGFKGLIDSIGLQIRCPRQSLISYNNVKYSNTVHQIGSRNNVGECRNELHFSMYRGT